MFFALTIGTTWLKATFDCSTVNDDVDDADDDEGDDDADGGDDDDEYDNIYHDGHDDDHHHGDHHNHGYDHDHDHAADDDDWGLGHMCPKGWDTCVQTPNKGQFSFCKGITLKNDKKIISLLNFTEKKSTWNVNNQ